MELECLSYSGVCCSCKVRFGVQNAIVAPFVPVERFAPSRYTAERARTSRGSRLFARVRPWEGQLDTMLRSRAVRNETYVLSCRDYRDLRYNVLLFTLIRVVIRLCKHVT